MTMFCFRTVLFLLAIYKIQESFSVNYGNIKITNMKICNDSNHTLTADAKIRNLKDGQQVYVDMWMTEEFGNDNRYQCQAFMKRGSKLQKVVEIKGKGACNALNRYGSKIWWEIEKMLGNERPGYCPVKAKTYVMDWYTLRYREIQVVGLVPNGNYFVDCKLFDQSGRLIKACVSFDALKTS